MSDGGVSDPANERLTIDVLEVERLREELLEPWQRQERRVESIDFISDTHFEMSVFQQIWSTPSSQAPTRLLSLGVYSKSRRPSLRVTAADGTLLPVLSRTEQAKILGYLYLQGVATRIANVVHDFDADDAQRLIDNVGFFVERVISAPTVRAREACDALRAWLHEVCCEDGWPVARAYLADDASWSSLEALIDSCQILVRVDEPRGAQTVLCHSYSQEFSYYFRSPDSNWSVRAARSRFHDDRSIGNSLRVVRNLAASLLTRAYMRFGILPTVLGRRCQNADHCESYYLLVREPAGTVCARNYWQEIDYKTLVSPSGVDDELFKISSMKDDAASERWHTTLACFATHATQSDPSRGENRCYLELRPDRSMDRVAALLLAMISAVVALAVHRQWYAHRPTENFLSIFLAVPGALTATLTRNASALSRRVTDGLLYLGYGAGASALLMAVTVPLNHESGVIASLPVVAALSASLLAIVLFWIELPSRLFDSPRGPMETATSAEPIVRCEKVFATIYLSVATIVLCALIFKIRYG